MEDSEEKAGPTGEREQLHSVHTGSLPELMAQLGFSLFVTTYQAGKLVLIRADQGRANTHFRNFASPMGLALRDGRLAIGTSTHVWEFRNQPDAARVLDPPGRHDACFLPRAAHVTGNIGIHEIAWTDTELWIVNTRFSCLCTLDRDHSFVPRWRPPFISAYEPSDRCHLNGLGLRDDRPRYATSLGESDTAAGWRQDKARSGCLMDIEAGSMIARGLCMPHSPRWYQGKLWILESGKGSLALVDLPTGRLQTVATLPGFTRGLDFLGPFAFIGLSQVRETAVFSGIPITEGARERICGVWVVDTRTGQTVAFLRFEGSVAEIFGVQVVADIRFPELLNEDEPAIANSFVLPDDALKDVAVRK